MPRAGSAQILLPWERLTGLLPQGVDAAQVLAAATLVAAGLWLAVLLVAATATRPARVRAAAATMELGEEPPAVVTLLGNRWRVRPEAVPATLLDLAARGMLSIEQVGPGHTICRVGRAPAEPLERYERLVLDHVQRLARGGVVPVTALTTGPQETSRRWWKVFERAVIADARERGLARPRWGRPVRLALAGVAAVPALLAALLISVLSGDLGAAPLAVPAVALLAWVGLLEVTTRFAGQRDTAAGREAARHWLGVRDWLEGNRTFATLPPAAVAIWDRYLAYGAALGVAAEAIRQVPMGAADDHHAWSDMGEHWRQVSIRYPTPRRQRVAPALVEWFRVSLPAEARFEGRVVRLRQRRTTEDEVTCYAAVDDGSADRLVAYEVPASSYGRLREGDLVAVTVAPRRREILSVEVRERAPDVPYSTDEWQDDVPSPAREALEATGLPAAARSYTGALGAARAIDLAALLRPEEVAEALGEPVAVERAVTIPVIAVPARMHVVRAKGSSSRNVLLQAFPGSLGQAALRTARRRGQPVPEVGDEAYRYDRDRSLVLRCGEHVLCIRLQSRRVRDRADALTRLGRVAAARLRASADPEPVG